MVSNFVGCFLGKKVNIKLLLASLKKLTYSKNPCCAIQKASYDSQKWKIVVKAACYSENSSESRL
jgi:hypothetical protein